MSNEPVATFYLYRRGGRIVSATVARVPPSPPLEGWETLTRIPISNNGRPAWRAFTVRRGHEGPDLERRHWPPEITAGAPDLVAPQGAGSGHRGHRRARRSSPLSRSTGESQGEGVKVGDTITYHGHQYRVLAITGDGRRIFIRDLATRQAIEIELSDLQTKKGTCQC